MGLFFFISLKISLIDVDWSTVSWWGKLCSNSLIRSPLVLYIKPLGFSLDLYNSINLSTTFSADLFVMFLCFSHKALFKSESFGSLSFKPWYLCILSILSIGTYILPPLRYSIFMFSVSSPLGPIINKPTYLPTPLSS